MKSIKTIADIAELAGVSKSTVSRALNDSDLISKKTRMHIQALAAEYQFETNQGARRLSIKKSQTIGLIYPESEYHRHMVTDPFFMEMLKGITSAVGEHHYDLLISQPRKEPMDETRRMLDSNRADGIIFLGCCQDGPYDLKNVRNKPIITFGSDFYDHISGVDCNNYDGGSQAASHLLECSCKHILFIGGPKDRPETIYRLDGFQTVLSENNHILPDENIQTGDYQSSSGFQLVDDWLKEGKPLDGVFACSDLMAIGALEACRKNGRVVGEDISIIGFDDIPFAQFSSPPLTTISQNIFKVGETLVHKLMQYMEDQIVTKSILPIELSIRQSTAISSDHN